MKTPPARILICLGPCYGEFHLPLDIDEQILCPNDRTHPVALYQNPSVHAGEQDVALDLDDDPFGVGSPLLEPTVGYCSVCGEARTEFYTCRDGGETVEKKNFDARQAGRRAVSKYGDALQRLADA